MILDSHNHRRLVNMKGSKAEYVFSQPRGLSVFSVRLCDYICNMSIYDTGIQDGWLLATSSTGETVNSKYCQ
jgi:hypothetical protein